ncbi:3-phosphoshikimate 1-carboxyvinyltransferase [Roseomonas sp. BN140053]|uniref:3-phosphoshikimate 1-carboxyvinyltransferase n=1 Tax=Roseomonas sp. BN140053 TaxID=3391898 RepID=UPI0039EC278A
MSNAAPVQDLPEIRPLRAAAPPAGLNGALRVPGRAVDGHGALVLGALAVGESRLEGLPDSPELERSAAALRALGAVVERATPGDWHVWGRGVGGLAEPAGVLELGASPTAAALFCGLLAGHPGFAVLGGGGDPAQPRSWRDVTDPLGAGGARFFGPANGGFPLAVEGARAPRPLHHRLPAAAAREKPALLVFGLLARGTTVLEEPAAAAPDGLETLLRQFGAPLRHGAAGTGRVIELDGQPELTAAPVTLPGDPALAAVALVAALLVPGSRLVLRGVALDPALMALLDALREMGAAIAVTGERRAAGGTLGDLAVSHGPLRALDLAAERLPALADAIPLLAVAAACAGGTSRFRGLGQGRFRDGGRLDALRALLAGNGVPTPLEGDDLVLRRDGAPPAGSGAVAAGADPRIAAAALVLGLAAATPVTLEGGTSLDTSFPGLVALLNGAAGGGAIGSA